MCVGAAQALHPQEPEDAKWTRSNQATQASNWRRVWSCCSSRSRPYSPALTSLGQRATDRGPQRITRRQAVIQSQLGNLTGTPALRNVWPLSATGLARWTAWWIRDHEAP